MRSARSEIRDVDIYSNVISSTPDARSRVIVRERVIGRDVRSRSKEIAAGSGRNDSRFEAVERSFDTLSRRHEANARSRERKIDGDR